MKKSLPITSFLLISSCSVGPNYKRPSATVPPDYKEAPPAYKESKDWKQAQPNAEIPRGKWWELYKDPNLNALEEQVAISNQNVLAAAANFREARAAVRVARSSLFPTLGVSPSISAGQSSRTLGGQVAALGSGFSSGGHGVSTTYDLPFDLSYQADVWGSIRRSVTAAVNTAQASAADLENAKLSYQATLAEDYFELHGSDSEERLLTDTLKSYQQYLDLTRYRFQSGIASEADIALAQTQLDTTEAQLIDLGVARAQYEHAIAILIGKPPAELTVPSFVLTAVPPPVPEGVPSQLLERRPDIAAAERSVAAANEQIGIAKAAYYPTISLTGAAGLESSSILQWMTWPSRFWAVGPQVAETLLDFGKRRGQVQETEAAYDSTVATYRQTVLTAFQQVEDNLAALRILEKEATAEDRAVEDAVHSLDVTTQQYKSGVADYLQVLTAQTTVLTNQVTAISIQIRRMTASVLLIEALGGGWDASQLPSSAALVSGK